MLRTQPRSSHFPRAAAFSFLISSFTILSIASMTRWDFA